MVSNRGTEAGEESDPFRSSGRVPIFQLCDEVVRAAALEGGAATFSCGDIDRPALVEGDADQLSGASRKRNCNTLFEFHSHEVSSGGGGLKPPTDDPEPARRARD
jgi:hypothetical protein